jgi:hypothetical protein
MSNHKVKGGNRLEGDRSRRKEVTIELTSDESREFAEEEVVWAKVVGHPWWPAVVSEKSYPTYHFDEGSPRLKRKEVTYRVSFFGESSQYLPIYAVPFCRRVRSRSTCPTGTISSNWPASRARGAIWILFGLR